MIKRDSRRQAVFESGDFTARAFTDDDGTIKDVAQSLGYNLDGGMSRIFGHVPEIWTGGKRIAVRSENGVELVLITVIIAPIAEIRLNITVIKADC